MDALCFVIGCSILAGGEDNQAGVISLELFIVYVAKKKLL